MKPDNLIQACVCGNTRVFSRQVEHDIPVLECHDCGVIHQLLEGWDEERYLDFYRKEYHTQFQEHKRVITYQDRYEHDRKVSRKRLDAYEKFIEPGMKGIDIGSSNSAFVHEANDLGYNCVGLEPGHDIGDDKVTIRGTLKSARLEANFYDFVTMHDSIEHMVDVNRALEIVKRILKPDGVLIVDLPDYFIPSGYHHWKQIEHLWFFTKFQFLNILTKYGFMVEQITQPIPGKLVFYARKT